MAESTDRNPTHREAEQMVADSLSRSRARRQPTKPEIIRNRIIASGVAIALGLLAGKAVFGNNTPSGVPENLGAVPEATREYLKTLPTERTEIPQGGGIDDAAYQVDPETFDESAHIRAGVEEAIGDDLRKELGIKGDENFIVPAHAPVDVPVVPSLDSVPPEAR